MRNLNLNIDDHDSQVTP